MQYVRFIAAFLVYTIIDVGWNISPIAQGMYKNLYEGERPRQDVGRLRQGDEPVGAAARFWLCSPFCCWIAFANSYLAIEPGGQGEQSAEGHQERLRAGHSGLRHLHSAPFS